MSEQRWSPAGRRALVTGLDREGFAAADALLERGAHVVVLDDVAPLDGAVARERADRAEILRTLGATVRARAATPAADLEQEPGVDLVVVGESPGLDRPYAEEAAARGIEVLADVELAWRLLPVRAEWLVVGGSARRRATADLAAAMAVAAGVRAAAAGGPDRPVVEAVLTAEAARLLVVEVSPWQAAFLTSVSPVASACLSLAGPAEDHPAGAAGMRRDAGQVYARTRLACLYALDDPRTEEAVRAVDVVEGCRAVGVGLGVPPVSALGLVEDVLCDRAFVERRHDAAAEVATLTDVEACLQGLLSPEVVRVALTAAGLVRAAGVPAAAVREALRAAPALGGMPELLPGTPRVVLDGDAVSVSTALAALTAARADVVWIAHPDAGAGEEVQRLLRLVAPLLRAVVLTSWPAAPAPQGAAAGSVLAGHLARHAPEVPVHVVAVADTDGRDGVGAALSAAARLAGGDDVVVWAPGVAAGGDLDAVRGAVLALQAGDRPDRRGDGEEE